MEVSSQSKTAQRGATQHIAGHRIALIDTLRGVAILLMLIYHFIFDLSHSKIGYLQEDFYSDPFWINTRLLIVTLFTGVMGISLYMAHHRGIHRDRFIRRLLILIGCALLITISTWFFMRSQYIYFGILHFIAVASVFGLLFLRFYWLNLIAGAGIIIASNLISLQAFSPRYLNWIGFMQGKPQTDDYAPLFPWLGVVLIGMFIAQWAFTRNHLAILAKWQGMNPVARILQYAGRHSLLIYMLHQPLFWAVLLGIKSLN